MSWRDYKNLLETKNTDPAAWQAARLANPNDPESALLHALNSLLTADGEAGLYDIAVLMLGLAEGAAQAEVGGDPYIPTDAEWAAHPEMEYAATDDDGDVYLYGITPPVVFGLIWRTDDVFSRYLKTIEPPADFHNTLRHRPEGV